MKNLLLLSALLFNVCFAQTLGGGTISHAPVFSVNGSGEIQFANSSWTLGGAANRIPNTAYFNDIDSTTATIGGFTGSVYAADGSVGSPSISFTNDTDAGLYSANTNTEIGVSVGGVDALRLLTASSGVNYFQMTPSATTASIDLAAAGTDTNIGMNITPKGTGTLALGGLAGQTQVVGTLESNGDFTVATSNFTVASATGNTGIAGTLGVDGATTLDQVTIDTTDGAFSVSGTNGVTINPTGALSLDSAGAIDIGDTSGTSLDLSKTGVMTTVKGTLNVDEAASFDSTLTADDIDSTTATTLAIGKSTATALEIADSGIMTTVEGTLNVDEAVTMDTTLEVTGNVGIGGTATTALDVFVSSSNVRIFGTGTATQGLLHLRGNTGQDTYMSFTEETTADLGGIGFSAGSTTMNFITGGTLSSGSTAMSIDENGVVGIGITPVTGTRLSLPLEDDAVTPTISFGDGDTGIYETSDDVLSFAIGGTREAYISASGVQTQDVLPMSTDAYSLGSTGRIWVDVITSFAVLQETTTPTAVAGFGKVYTKADNILYFQDGGGTEHALTTVDTDYGEFYWDNNSNETVIETASTPIMLRETTTGSLMNWTYDAGSTGAITAYSDGTGKVNVASAGHGLVSGDIISIRGTTNYNGVWEVTYIDDDNFSIPDTWVADDGASDWDEGAYLLAGTGAAGTYSMSYEVSATVGAADTLTLQFYNNDTACTKCIGSRKFAMNDQGHLNGQAIIPVAVGDRISLTVTSDGTADVTVQYGNLMLHRL